MIETIGEFNNVLYEISNENHPASTDWQYHMIQYIKKAEIERENSHPVGMTFQYRGGDNEILFKSPADWISPNNEGGYCDDPPAGTGAKVIISDTDHLWGIGGNRKWVWKSFLRGMNPIFMDPYNGKVLSRGAESTWAEEVRIAMGQTKRFADKMDLIRAVPAGELSSSKYCLANHGQEYLVYIPESNQVEVDLSSAEGNFSVSWFNPFTEKTVNGEDIKGNQPVKLVSPFDAEEAVLSLEHK